MGLKFIKYLCLIVLLTAFFTFVKAQSGLCPPNLDFEMGNFTNWNCQSGTVIVSGGKNMIIWTGSGEIPGRHTIIPALGAGFDFYGLFPRNCPNGSGYSVQLGNDATQAQAEGLSYVYTIPATTTLFSIFFHYAVVFEDPNHLPEQQPRFRARITDLTVGAQVPCVTFDFISSSSLPGFQVSPVNPTVLYKDWTPVTLNLTGLAGHTIMLEFITSDCTQTGHFGYAYVDVNSSCSNAIGGTTICLGDNSTTLTAPYGFQQYEWYSDNTFSTILATTQVLTLTPPPAVGTVFPVIVIPYAGYGCRDTLYATMTVSSTTPNAGPDRTTCNYSQVQIGMPPSPGFSYLWSPASLLDDPTLSNPTAQNLPLGTTQFTLRATNIVTGCSGYDTMYVTTRTIDTALQVTGITEFCLGDPSNLSISVNNTINAVQWYNDSGPITGATGLNYAPTAAGNYWAQVTQNGCIDSTRTVPVIIHVLPQAQFSPLIDTGCVTLNSFTFTNASAITDGSALSYVWKFSDGNRQQTQNAVRTFTNTGQYNVELVATSAFGCKDSTIGLVRVLPNAAPDFMWDSICVDRPVLFSNLSNENGSAQVAYNWAFNNGVPGSPVKNPAPVVYSSPGIITVSLQSTALGCENDPKTVTKTVWVNKPLPGVRYRDVIVQQYQSTSLKVRDTVGTIYNWRPQIQLNNYDRAITDFTAGDDVEYKIDITDVHTCITTDTLKVLVMKIPGIFVPTGFTPNGDGLNDLAIPVAVGIKSFKRFTIYNRWGEIVFTTNTQNKGWDGKYKGILQPTGVFVWTLEYVTTYDETAIQKGIITLIR